MQPRCSVLHSRENPAQAIVGACRNASRLDQAVGLSNAGCPYPAKSHAQPIPDPALDALGLGIETLILKRDGLEVEGCQLTEINLDEMIEKCRHFGS